MKVKSKSADVRGEMIHHTIVSLQYAEKMLETDQSIDPQTHMIPFLSLYKLHNKKHSRRSVFELKVIILKIKDAVELMYRASQR